MKNIVRDVSLLSLVVGLCFSSCSGPSIEIDSNQVIKDLKQDVMVLADDDMEGRETGTPGEKKAADFIVKRFQEIGIGAFGTDGFLQGYDRKIKANPHAEGDSPDDTVITGNNVIGYIDNKADHYVVIGAHYDHLGYGEDGSLHRGEKAIHNGADDNASGIAIMLYLADRLGNNQIAENHNYVFIAFSGEEKGLWGSNYFVKNPTYDLEKTSFMINMDMVGRLNEERKIAINGVGTSPGFDALLDSMNTYEFSVVKSLSGVGPSDHTSFYLQDLPVLQFFTGQHEDYHKPSDDLELLNYEGMMDIGNYIYDFISALDGEGKIEFTKTVDESAETPRFTVTLGVVPDYLYDEKGMRIDGVSEGRPASKAGLIKGDIVIELGGVEVIDMMSYMKQLATYKEGDKATVKVLRDNAEVEAEVQF